MQPNSPKPDPLDEPVPTRLLLAVMDDRDEAAAEATRLRAELGRLRPALAEAQHRLAAIESSTAWRSTAPLRHLLLRLRRTRPASAPPPPPPAPTPDEPSAAAARILLRLQAARGEGPPCTS